jgi:hypothetical protein
MLHIVQCAAQGHVRRFRAAGRESFMSKKNLISIFAAATLLLSALFAATHDFVPDFTFKGSSLAGWHTMGSASWRAENGEIAGTPQSPDGGWLVLDKGYQDLELYTEFRCADKCDVGILFRTEKTSDGGWKGVYSSLAGDPGTFDLTLSADGKELKRTDRPTCRDSPPPRPPWLKNRKQQPSLRRLPPEPRPQAAVEEDAAVLPPPGRKSRPAIGTPPTSSSTPTWSPPD